MTWDDRALRIDKDSPTPVWVQMADDLRSDITSGALPAKSRLPAGPELGEIYGVARDTAVKAVRKLQDEGLVVITNGKGTYVVAQ